MDNYSVMFNYNNIIMIPYCTIAAYLSSMPTRTVCTRLTPLLISISYFWTIQESYICIITGVLSSAGCSVVYLLLLAIRSNIPSQNLCFLKKNKKLLFFISVNQYWALLAADAKRMNLDNDMANLSVRLCLFVSPLNAEIWIWCLTELWLFFWSSIFYFHLSF